MWLKRLQESLGRVGIIRLYRGVSIGGNGHYWSTDREWSRQFTQSGLDSEIREIGIDSDKILRMKPLPSANSEDEITMGIQRASDGGYVGFFVSEGMGQPESVFLLRRIK